jgi:hypothetical protein
MKIITVLSFLWSTGGKKLAGEKSCPIATLSTTNPTWTDPESNPGLRGEKPATNRLSHVTQILKLNVTVEHVQLE